MPLTLPGVAPVANILDGAPVPGFVAVVAVLDDGVVVCLANNDVPLDDPLLNQRLFSQPVSPTPARNNPARPNTDCLRILIILPPKSRLQYH